MCGRYTVQATTEEMAARFAADVEPTPSARTEAVDEPKYNVAPTSLVPVVAVRDDARLLRIRKWGLVPHWAKNPKVGARMINARSETFTTSPAFRDAAKRPHRHCLIVADGFYEWDRRGQTKQPFHISVDGGGLFAFAGLTASWTGPVPDGGGDAPQLKTCTILTTEANAEMAAIHDRMPVLLTPDEEAIWLGDDVDAALALAAAPRPDGLVTLRPVSTYVNNVRHQGPECLAPAQPVAP